MRTSRIFVAVGIAAAAALLSPAPSQALFHISVIEEVLASLDGDADRQFVEIEMLIAAQNLVSNSVLASFDAEGVYIEDILVVPEDVPIGAAGARWTMATAEFQEEYDFDADFTIPAGLPLGGGMICWGAPGILPPADPASWDHTDPGNYVDCIAYGSYSGPTNPLIGEPTPLVPEGHSLVRIAETHASAADFACADVAMPTNNAGDSVDVPATTSCGTGRGSGVQVTPDDERVLINKDVGDERWSITRNLDDLTVTGNVFFPEGGDPLFLFCEQEDEVDGDLRLACFGSESCTSAGCPDFDFIADVALPESFFEPPVAVAAIAARIGGAVRERAAAAVGRGAGLLGERGSGIQRTPDGERVLINKDVGDERWAITRNLDDSTVTGNVFFPEGGDPIFLFCEQTGQVGDDLLLACSAADRCTDTSCPAFEPVAEVTLPESFFEPPVGPEPSPTPTATPDATPTEEPSPEPSAPAVVPTPYDPYS